jgi:hypothetical protein
MDFAQSPPVSSVSSFSAMTSVSEHFTTAYRMIKEDNSTCHVDVPLKDIDWSFSHKFPLPWSLGLYS